MTSQMTYLPHPYRPGRIDEIKSSFGATEPVLGDCPSEFAGSSIIGGEKWESFRPWSIMELVSRSGQKTEQNPIISRYPFISSKRHQCDALQEPLRRHTRTSSRSERTDTEMLPAPSYKMPINGEFLFLFTVTWPPDALVLPIRHNRIETLPIGMSRTGLLVVGVEDRRYLFEHADFLKPFIRRRTAGRPAMTSSWWVWVWAGNWGALLGEISSWLWNVISNFSECTERQTGIYKCQSPVAMLCWTEVMTGAICCFCGMVKHRDRLQSPSTPKLGSGNFLLHQHLPFPS